jgi:molybdopterin molybdotransferase
MPEFLTLKPPQEALGILLEAMGRPGKTEKIRTEDALGRVLSKPARAPYDLPSFRRSSVDGYAVIAADTYGASASLPAYLPLIGEVSMGTVPTFMIEKGHCALIHTGGMLPEGANAVVMVEDTQQTRDGEVEVFRAVADGENVIQIGEDVREGEEIIPIGRVIRPAEIGGLMAMGIIEIEAAVSPKVGIISTGDEVIPPGEEMKPGQVRDINSYTLAGLVAQAGGVPKLYGIFSDEKEKVAAAVRQAYKECDLVVVTAGSSASARDLTSVVIDELGEPGVLVHGVNVRPGKPTILGVCGEKPVIGLPGNPVSALVIARIFVVGVIKALLGLDQNRRKGVVQAKLMVNLSSQSGREDWVAVRLEDRGRGLEAEPVFGKSNLIFTLVKADGLLKVPADANGITAGEIVDVWPF